MAALGVFIGTFIIIFILFKFIFYGTILMNICMVIVAAFLACIINRFAENFIPRGLISSCKKAVLVTGCDSGFGNLLVRQLDILGFQVFAGCLSPEADCCQKLKSECSNNVHILALNVTKPDEVQSAYKYVCSNLNGNELWAVVNNAGIATFAEFEWCPIELYENIIAVNTLGPIRVCKTFMPLLRESQGRIIIVASLAGRYTFPGFTAYSMSKHANISLADGLRREMKKWGIQVSTIEPSLYKTAITDEKPLRNSVMKMWNALPGEIRDAYGEDYFSAFLESISHHMVRARPEVQEVVTDMVDAIVSRQAKINYVPNIMVQLRAFILGSLSTSLLDVFMSLNAPRASVRNKKN